MKKTHINVNCYLLNINDAKALETNICETAYASAYITAYIAKQI